MRLKFGNYSIKLNTILVIIIASIVMSGATIFSYIRIPRIWLCGVIGIVYLILKKDTYVMSTSIGKIFGVWILFLVVNWQFSYTPVNTRNAVIIFASLYFLLCYEFKIKDMQLFYKIVRVICIIFAISVIVNALIPSLIYGPLSGFVVFDTNAIKEEVARDEVSVIITKTPCVLLDKRKKPLYLAHEDQCKKCGLCMKPGCPAMTKNADGSVHIDDTMCTGCGLCEKLCKFNVIELVKEGE